MKKIAVLIPNYNGFYFIEDTVKACKKSFPEYEIVVVDDASTDSSVTLLSCLDITLLKREKNGGFAAAVNTGLQYLLSHNVDFIIVSNSDISIDTSIAFEIIKYLNDIQSDIGVMGFQEAGAPYFERHTDDKVSGFFFCLNSMVIQKIGYLDEKYIMYGEEQDYFKRVLKAGFKIVQSNILIPHDGEKSGSGSLKNSWYAIRNSLRLELKFLSVKGLLRTMCFLFLIINRLYSPEPDASINRLLRPGVLKGNLMLLTAIVWNLYMLPVTIRSRSNEYKCY